MLLAFLNEGFHEVWCEGEGFVACFAGEGDGVACPFFDRLCACGCGGGRRWWDWEGVKFFERGGDGII